MKSLGAWKVLHAGEDKPRIGPSDADALLALKKGVGSSNSISFNQSCTV
jgi:hypothetical protein